MVDKVIDTDVDRVTFSGTNIEIRVYKLPESIELKAHKGKCRYCDGIVKMIRDSITGRLQFDDCRCLVCGQPYFVKLDPSETPESWEIKQWQQKEEDERQNEELEENIEEPLEN